MSQTKKDTTISKRPPTDERSMDGRCPLRLNTFPTTPCPLALKYLERIKRSQYNVSHEPEADECPFAVLDKECNYCFFSYIASNRGTEHAIIDIAELTCSTQPATYTAITKASEFIKASGLKNKIKDG